MTRRQTLAGFTAKVATTSFGAVAAVDSRPPRAEPLRPSFSEKENTGIGSSRTGADSAGYTYGDTAAVCVDRKTRRKPHKRLRAARRTRRIDCRI